MANTVLWAFTVYLLRMNCMFRPPYLQPGDKVALVSPAGSIESGYVHDAVVTLRSWGLEPIVAPHALASFGYFAGTDEERISDMQWALDSDDIRAIFCNRGGYGSLRIVEQLDYSLFQGSPKWLIGFSDITVFHSKLNTLGIESMHAAMPKSFRTTSSDALLRLKDFLFGNITAYRIPPHPFNRTGTIRAELTGGNLTLLHCMHSSILECRHQSSILFIEDVGENLYAIDRMLQSLKLTDKFSRLQGVIVGEFSAMKGLNFGKNAYEIIQDLLADYHYPVCYGFPAGHVSDNYPLIIGSTIEIEITPEGATISFLDE